MKLTKSQIIESLQHEVSALCVQRDAAMSGYDDLVTEITKLRKHVCTSCDIDDVEYFRRLGYNEALGDACRLIQGGKEKTL